MLLLLQFTAFDLYFPNVANYNGHAFDHLTIMDGDGTTLMEKSCGPDINGSILVGDKMIGSFLPVPIRSRSNIVNLTFSSDSSINTWPGWSLSWTAVTPGECQHGLNYLDNLSASCSLIFDIIVDYFLSITELHKQLWCFFFFSASLFFSSHP